MPISYRDALVETANDIIAEARSNIQQNQNINSGSLLSSIKILADNGDSLVIGSDMDYAGYIEYGRGPVRPINKQYLSWIDKSSGKRIFAKYAKATEPQPFMEPAVILKLEKFPLIIAQKVEKTIDELKKNG